MKKTIEYKGYTFTKMNKEKAYAIKRSVDAHKFEGLGFWYDDWSNAKDEALIYCKQLAHAIGCDDWAVIGANTCTFSFGAYYEDEDKLIVLYCTRDNDYLFIE